MTLDAITKDLHGLSIGPVNVFLVEDGRDLLLIDAGLPGNEDAILGGIAKLGRAPGDLKHIVLTHAHPDHIGSAATLVRATGAKVWMHALDAPIAEGKAKMRPIKPAPELLMKLLYVVLSRSQPAVEPVMVDGLLADGDVFPFAGGLTAIHVPGHCAGQIALLWRDRGVLLVADACAHLFGLGSPLGYEDLAEGRRSQRKLASLRFEIACFGHGKPILHGAEKRFREKWGRI